MTDVSKALEHIKRITREGPQWNAYDLANRESAFDNHIATILNAVASGELVPCAQADGLVEAAKPLAAMAERYDPPEDCGDTMECWSRTALPKIGHLRKLRAALTAWENLNG